MSLKGNSRRWPLPRSDAIIDLPREVNHVCMQAGHLFVMRLPAHYIAVFHSAPIVDANCGDFVLPDGKSSLLTKVINEGQSNYKTCWYIYTVYAHGY